MPYSYQYQQQISTLSIQCQKQIISSKSIPKKAIILSSNQRSMELDELVTLCNIFFSGEINAQIMLKKHLCFFQTVAYIDDDVFDKNLYQCFFFVCLFGFFFFFFLLLNKVLFFLTTDKQFVAALLSVALCWLVFLCFQTNVCLFSFALQLGGWNVTGSFNIDKYDFNDTMRKMEAWYVEQPFFTIFITADEKNSSRNELQVSNGAFKVAAISLVDIERC